MVVEQILQRLKRFRKRGPSWWDAPCPAHDDGSSMLYVVQWPDGQIFLHCFAGCELKAVLDALELKVEDLSDRPFLVDRHAQRNSAETDGVLNTIKLLAHEARIVAIAAESISQGKALAADDVSRVRDAAVVLREAWMHV